MQTENNAKFMGLMVALSEVFGGGEQISKLKAEIYYQVLKFHNINDLEKAVSKMISTRVYSSFPKPGEIIQAMEGSREEQGLLAWHKVIRALRRIGSYASIRSKDKAIHSVIEFMGGWPAAGEWLEKDLPWKQKEFERLYVIMKEKGGGNDYLPGIFEIQNKADGYDQPVEVVSIDGDEGQNLIE